jgi:hypothetical protein
MSMTLNMREFNAALAQYLAMTSRTLPVAINTALLFIIRRARALTPIASRSKIEAQYGATTTQKVSKKTGKVRNVVNYSQQAPIGIVIWRLRKAGKALPASPQLWKMARQLRGRALSSIGTLKAGWNTALRVLGIATGSYDDLSGPRVRHPSAAHLAQPGFSPVAEVLYQAAIRDQGSQNLTIEPRVELALAEAFAAEQFHMEQYVAKRLQADADKFNAK